MARLNRSDTITKEMDELALEMLKTAKDKDGSAAGLDTRLDVFEKVGKWVAVRNKLEVDDGNTIQSYKERLHGTPPKREGRRTRGDRLSAFKSSLPTANDGGSVSDLDDAGGKDAIAS